MKMFSSSVDERPTEDEVRDRRVEVARRNSKWTEIEEPSALVRRGRVLVHADSDEVFKPYTGVVFASGATTVIADYTALHFYVRDNGELTFLELEPGTWSERIERKARRARR